MKYDLSAFAAMLLAILGVGTGYVLVVVALYRRHETVGRRKRTHGPVLAAAARDLNSALKAAALAEAQRRVTEPSLTQGPQYGDGRPAGRRPRNAAVPTMRPAPRTISPARPAARLAHTPEAPHHYAGGLIAGVYYAPGYYAVRFWEPSALDRAIAAYDRAAVPPSAEPIPVPEPAPAADPGPWFGPEDR